MVCWWFGLFVPLHVNCSVSSIVCRALSSPPSHRTTPRSSVNVPLVFHFCFEFIVFIDEFSTEWTYNRYVFGRSFVHLFGLKLDLCNYFPTWRCALVYRLFFVSLKAVFCKREKANLIKEWKFIPNYSFDFNDDVAELSQFKFSMVIFLLLNRGNAPFNMNNSVKCKR